MIVGGGTVLIDPFDHEIPGTAMKDDDGNEMRGLRERTSTIWRTVIGSLPAMSHKDEDDKYHDGINSGRFLIVVTAVGASLPA